MRRSICTRVASLLLAHTAAGCSDSTALNFETNSTSTVLCHLEPASIALIATPANGSVAGVRTFLLAELRDAMGRRVWSDGGEVVVTVGYPVALHAANGKPFVQQIQVSAKAVNGSANVSLTITSATTHRLLVSTSGIRPGIASIVTPPITIVPAPPAVLQLLHQPFGGVHCAPLALQPLLHVADRWNNTWPADGAAVHASLIAGASGAVRLVGQLSANMSDGRAQFADLGLNGSAASQSISFDLMLPSESPPALRFSVISLPFDCHGRPSQLRLLPGSPPLMDVADADGFRVTSAEGVALSTSLRHPDGSELTVGTTVASVRGLWSFSHASDPFAVAANGERQTEIIFRANLSKLLLSNSSCCSLTLPSYSSTGESAAALYVPALRIVRLRAHNTGHQGGYGRGDTIEIRFNLRTNLADFSLGQALDRLAVGQLFLFSHSMGDAQDAFSGQWRDGCTFIVRAGNTTGAVLPTGVFSVRVRDDIHDLLDEARRLRVGSTASSPALEGTFGALQGQEGRLDPLRAAMPQLALRRYTPNSSLPAGLRVGPMMWHSISPFGAALPDRTSECDDHS